MPWLAQRSVTGLACFVCLGAVVLGLAATKDKAQIELHDGRLYIQWGAPSSGPPLAEGAIEVQPLRLSLVVWYMILALVCLRLNLLVHQIISASNDAYLLVSTSCVCTAAPHATTAETCLQPAQQVCLTLG